MKKLIIIIKNRIICEKKRKRDGVWERERRGERKKNYDEKSRLPTPSCWMSLWKELCARLGGKSGKCRRFFLLSRPAHSRRCAIDGTYLLHFHFTLGIYGWWILVTRFGGERPTRLQRPMIIRGVTLIDWLGRNGVRGVSLPGSSPLDERNRLIDSSSSSSSTTVPFPPSFRTGHPITHKPSIALQSSHHPNVTSKFSINS